MKSNEDVVNILTGLENKFDRIVTTVDILNRVLSRKLSSKINIDQLNRREVMNKLNVVLRFIASSSRVKYREIVDNYTPNVVNKVN